MLKKYKLVSWIASNIEDERHEILSTKEDFTYRKFLEALQVPKELAVAKIFPAILNTILLLHFLSSAQFCLGGFLLLKLQITKGKPFFIEGRRYLDIIIDSCEIGM